MECFLVRKEPGGWGRVYRLDAAETAVLGRDPASQVVLSDTECSRRHAAITCREGRWTVRDLDSLNGTQLDGRPITESALRPGATLSVGHTEFVFVDSVEHLRDVVDPDGESEPIAVRARQGPTQILQLDEAALSARPRAERSLARLYGSALDLNTQPSVDALLERALELFEEAVAIDAGAILLVDETNRPSVRATRPPDDGRYVPPDATLVNLVLREREAVLTGQGPTGVGDQICVPILVHERLLGIVHLYSTRPDLELTSQDLDFCVALATQVAVAIDSLSTREGLERVNVELRESLRVESELIGESRAVRDLVAMIGRVAQTHSTVLVRGESGVGKELVARAIHQNSDRAAGPFICLNCAALAESLLESQLFGHEKGAFTGATARKVGKFEAARGGTIFLDEIGEMKAETQAKFLRVLEGHPFERVGGGDPITSDARVVAATNRPLEDDVAEGRFRQDLYYRLKVVEIHVPPLREHMDDMPVLVDHFLARFRQEIGRPVGGIGEAARAKLLGHCWPGNVRELKNVIERAVGLAEGDRIEATDIVLGPGDSLDEPAGARYDAVSLEELEKRHVAATLAHTGWNKAQAAAILGIERSTLNRKIRRYGLRP